MKYILKIVVLVFIVSSVSAQQIPITSQYMLNDYLLNPAVAGSTEYMPISLSGRDQWTGLEGAPRTQFLSLHSKLGKKMGVGGYVFRDETGIISRQGVQLSYAYHLSLSDKSKLSFSVAGMLFFHDINRAAFDPEDRDDETLNNISVNGMSPDINFGILYYTDKMKVGISAPQLIQNKMYNSDGSVTSLLARHYYFFNEHKIGLGDNFAAIQSFVVKYTQGAPFQFDVNSRLVFKEKIWLGASYRYNAAAVGMIGFSFKNLSLGYAYDYALTDLGNYATGGHEIFLSLKVFKKETEDQPSINF